MDFIKNIDFSILNFIQNNCRNVYMDTFMPIITMLGNSGALWIGIAIIILINKKYRKYGYMLVVALILTLIIGNLTLKPLVGRLRPFDVIPLINGLLINNPLDFSFPSGHTMCSFASSIVMLKLNKNLGIFCIILSSIIGFSRLYLYVHYPSDVLVGMIIGVLVGSATVRLFKNMKI